MPSTFFKPFPLRENYKLGNDSYLLVDITRDSTIKANFSNVESFIEYEIKEGETPVMIADKLYDDEELAWTILHYNTIIDYYNEWPMSQENLRRFIIEQYADPFAIHHYESGATSNRVSLNHPEYDRFPVTNFEYETQQNDAKRFIRLIRPDVIGSYVNAFEESVSVL